MSDSDEYDDSSANIGIELGRRHRFYAPNLAITEKRKELAKIKISQMAGEDAAEAKEYERMKRVSNALREAAKAETVLNSGPKWRETTKSREAKAKKEREEASQPKDDGWEKECRRSCSYSVPLVRETVKSKGMKEKNREKRRESFVDKESLDLESLRRMASEAIQKERDQGTPSYPMNQAYVGRLEHSQDMAREKPVDELEELRRKWEALKVSASQTDVRLNETAKRRLKREKSCLLEEPSREQARKSIVEGPAVKYNNAATLRNVKTKMSRLTPRELEERDLLNLKRKASTARLSVCCEEQRPHAATERRKSFTSDKIKVMGIDKEEEEIRKLREKAEAAKNSAKWEIYDTKSSLGRSRVEPKEALEDDLDTLQRIAKKYMQQEAPVVRLSKAQETCLRNLQYDETMPKLDDLETLRIMAEKAKTSSDAPFVGSTDGTRSSEARKIATHKRILEWDRLPEDESSLAILAAMAARAKEESEIPVKHTVSSLLKYLQNAK